LVPNLGLVRIEAGTSFVIADLPGLVEGAHEGKGRGHDFLRHAERTRVFIHVLDAAAPDREAVDDFNTINRELALYQQELAQRRQLVALNKMDLLPPPEALDRTEASLREQGYEVFRISALSGAGVSQLMGRAAQVLAEEGEPRAEEIPAEPETPKRVKRALRVERVESNRYEVTGEDVERAVVMTDLSNEESVRYLHRRLQQMGVIKRLRDLGAKDGDQVVIGAIQLDFVD
jgi:GTP-binding protein